MLAQRVFVQLNFRPVDEVKDVTGCRGSLKAEPATLPDADHQSRSLILYLKRWKMRKPEE